MIDYILTRVLVFDTVGCETPLRRGRLWGLMMIRWEKEVELFTVEELIDEVLRWHRTMADPPNNYDAQLLKHVATVLQEQWDRIGQLEDELEEKR